MTPPAQDGIPHRWWLTVSALILALILLAVIALRWTGGEESRGGPMLPVPSDAPSAPTLPPAPVPPVSVIDEVPLTLPQELRAAHGSFYLEAGETYVATFAVSTVKPPEQPGLGMYLGITFSCSGVDGWESEWIGGTENLLRGEPVTYRNQLLLSPDEDQVVSCSVRANATYDDVAAAGATVDLDIHWEVEMVKGMAVSTPADERLPMTVDPGKQAITLSENVAFKDLPTRRVSMLSSLHLTTCTVVNGSREAGKTWCAEGDLDENGSEFTLALRVDVLDENSEVCASVGREETSETLSLERHHQLLSLTGEFDIPKTLCGETLRTAVVVVNRGPASLVVHASNSSLITLAP